MVHPLVEYFRCPEHVAVLGVAEGLSQEPGYVRVGDVVCYGRVRGEPGQSSDGVADAAAGTLAVADGRVVLPFDLAELVGNLRHERYPEAQQAIASMASSSVVRSLYYLMRPLLQVPMRKRVQRLHLRDWRTIAFPRWPVDVSVERLMRQAAGLALASGEITEFPFIWFWPAGAPAAAMMTHDVEGPAGVEFCAALMDMDDEFGVPASFQVVPEARWSSRADTRRLVERLRGRGFEVNVHDLAHDGRLFRGRERFLRRAAVINARSREIGSRGFRSGAMYRRQDWLEALDIAYDMSVPNVAHLEPQRGGCCTVMPYFNGHVLELPLTTAQDYTIFHVLGEYSTALWQQQVDEILAENGLASFIAHPDYLREPRARAIYVELLQMLAALRAERGVWLAPPSAIDAWWRERREMTLVKDATSWRVQGPGSERACVAFARLDGDRVVYDVDETRHAA